jgi:hypothetical protein
VTAAPDPRFAPLVEEFLRGDHSVPDFADGFRGVVNEVAKARPLEGLEVDLFYALEQWETAGWGERPDVVERLRSLARAIVDSE